MSLDNKVALITGAAGGIGKAISLAFGAAGARVFLSGTNEEKLKDLSAELRAEGVEAAYKAVDVRAVGGCRELVDAAVQTMGSLDILVNSAGINRPQKSEDVTEENWDAILDINLKATFFLCQAAAKEMMKKGGGKIVNISSQAGLIALPLRAAYCSSKGGVNQLTRTLAVEWAKDNILVNAVAPTFVVTPLTKGMFENKAFLDYVLGSIPLGRMAEPEEIAYATLFLASDLANMITGHILTVDGGWTVQ
ncbi:MAG: SDR family oxidoreductase [Desulfomonile tiedjei]|nr:SDR family oxidoreductase [Desulfomonile tiedjei]